MSIRYYIIFAALFLSCGEPEKKPIETQVDRNKIDALFGKDVSQLNFDHLYVVLDSSSYERLTRDSLWRTSYAAIDKGLPHFEPIDENSTSGYLRGHRHYIEILGPDNAYGEPVGKSGIGFLLDNGEEHFHLGVEPRLKTKEHPVLNGSETVDVALRGQNETWFKAFYTKGPKTKLPTWYAFYNPVFLDSLYKKEHSQYSREAFLRKGYAKERLFNGIASIEMVCTPQDYSRIGQEMRHLGCKLLEKKGKQLVVQSGDVILKIRPSTVIAHSRIERIRCHLNAPDTSNTRMGNLTIANRGRTSVWEFDGIFENEPLK